MSTVFHDEHDLEDDDDDFDELASLPPRSRWRWLANASWGRVLIGIPAIAAMIAAIAVAVAPRGNIEGAYRTMVVDALSAQQFRRAIVGAERLLQKSPFNPEYRFWLGMAFDNAGDKDAAQQIMDGLAPNDRAGYGPAHFWQADRLLRQEPLTATAVRDAELHLRRVDPEKINSEAVMRRMALVMLKTNRLEDARDYLGGADLSANPDLRVAYAEALLKHGRKEDAERELKTAIDELRERVNKLGKSASDAGFARRALADALILRGDYPGAQRVLEEGVVIGPADRYARPLAQFYAKWLSAVESGAAAPPKTSAVENSIDLLAKNNDDSLMSNGLLSFLYQQTGRFEKAVERLEAVSKTHPDAAFDLVRLYSRLNKPKEAATAAKSAIGMLTELIARNPDDHGVRERLAEALLLVGEHEKAVGVLQEARKRGDRSGYRTLLARAYVAWWDACLVGKSRVQGSRLDLLKRAIDVDPWNPLVFSRLGATQGGDAKAAREMVTSLLASGESPPAAIHWILGNEAWLRGEKGLAKTHLEQAYRLAPTNPLVLNNYAWMLAFGDKPDLAGALGLAEEGVKAAPKALELRDTRGRIYAKAGDWAKAVADLQLCVAVKKNDPEFLHVLAEACEQTGLSDLAAQYRKQADGLRKARTDAGARQ